MFDSKKSELEKKLEGMTLPKDNQIVQQTVSEYLTELFDSEGEFRQNLTQAEDYLLQATMSLLTAQQEMSKTFICQTIRFNTVHNDVKEGTIEGSTEKATPKKSYQDYLGINITATQTGIGAATGALVGKLAFGGWGAVFGAIAGTAVMVYLASRNGNEKPEESVIKPVSTIRTEIVNEPLDVQGFIEVVGGICDSVDNLITTFRAQVNRVIDKYESMEKPTIEKQYGFLLENIQTLIGYKRTHSSEDEKYLKKLHLRIEDLAECLENYNLTTEEYDGNNEHLFELIPSPETTEVKMAYPAIVRDGIAVLKGKVFIPANK
jgi:hypothetical protein